MLSLSCCCCCCSWWWWWWWWWRWCWCVLFGTCHVIYWCRIELVDWPSASRHNDEHFGVCNEICRFLTLFFLSHNLSISHSLFLSLRFLPLSSLNTSSPSQILWPLFRSFEIEAIKNHKNFFCLLATLYNFAIMNESNTDKEPKQRKKKRKQQQRQWQQQQQQQHQ